MSEAKAKTRGRPRGRPRAFDPEKALHEARDVFWDAGYAASSLDELSAAMAMNRPSVYAAFGDKEALYLQTLEGYRDDGAAAMRAALDPRKPLAEGLREMYAGALELYFSNTPAPRGCFLIGTAATEAVRNEKVRATYRGSLALFDSLLEERFRLAKKTGEIDAGSDPAILAKLADSIMFALAVRSRSGEGRAACEAVAEAGVAMLCGTPAKPRSKRS
jgi:AcrR family transcriptional regulator